MVLTLVHAYENELAEEIVGKRSFLPTAGVKRCAKTQYTQTTKEPIEGERRALHTNKSATGFAGVRKQVRLGP